MNNIIPCDFKRHAGCDVKQRYVCESVCTAAEVNLQPTCGLIVVDADPV